MADCVITLADSIVKEFVATVQIPVGFSIDEEHAYPYKVYLSLDKSAVDFIVREELFKSVITVPGLGEEQTEQNMECESRLRVLKFEGPLFYNSIISGFIPNSELKAIISGDEPIEMPGPTAFSTTDTVLIGDTIGYACYECSLPENIIDGFDVTISQLPEFVIDNKGNMVTHNPENEETFFNVLKGTETQIIHVPYTLTLSPKPVIKG